MVMVKRLVSERELRQTKDETVRTAVVLHSLM